MKGRMWRRAAPFLTAALALSLLAHAPRARAQGGLSSAEQKFVMTAAADGALEVELGRLASQRAASDDVRRFGARMLEDHSKAGDELRQLAASKGLRVPGGLDQKQRAVVSRLASLSGAAFDREYVKLMLKEHKQAVSLFQKQAGQGRDAQVRAFASRMLPALQTHLSMIQDISNEMK